MFALLLLFLSSAILGASAPLVDKNQQVIRSVIERNLIAEAEFAAKAVDNYHKEKGIYPSDLDEALALYPTRAIEFDGRVKYRIAFDVVDQNWQFDRAVVWLQSIRNGANENDFLLDNKCGTGGFSTAQSWCPPVVLFSKKYESNSNAVNDLAEARDFISRTLQKFTTIFAATNVFPNQSAATGTLENGDQQSLAQMVGYTGLKEDCSTQFLYEDVSFDCDDIYSPKLGSEVIYNYFEPQHIGLYIVTPLKRADGQQIIIGVEIRV